LACNDRPFERCRSCLDHKSATAYLAWLSIRARDVVHGRWPIFEKVATLLLEQKTISGYELRAAILPPPIR
jgi:hypothetical protein